MTESTLADRLWWARRRKRVGANILAREAGCPQSLISSLERNNSDRSKYTNAFAKALQVDAHWLATGNGHAPESFDAAEVRKARAKHSAGDEFFDSAAPVRLKPAAPRPHWSEGANDDAEPDAVVLWVQIIPKIRQLRKLVGSKQFAALLESLEHLDPLVGEKPDRHNKVGS